jgi:hypothetical protein
MFKPRFEFEYSNQFSKIPDLKILRKLFKFIPSFLHFKFGLNAFESLTFKLKSLFEKLEK